MFDKQGSYVILNGEIVKRTNASFPIYNTLPCNNIYFCELMHGNGGEVQFVFEHFEVIQKTCEYFGLAYPVEFKNNFQLIRREIEKIIHKNRLFQGVQICLHIFAEKNNKNKPLNYFVDIKKIENDVYILNKSGLRMDIFEQQAKPVTPMSVFCLTNQSYQLATEQYIALNRLHDGFILNEKGNIVESLFGNIFITKDEKLYTPPLSEGCTNRVIRTKVIDVAIMKGYRMLEISTLTPEILLDADEVMVADPLNGLQWVSAIRQRRYFNKQAQKLIDGLNELAFGLK